MVEIDEVVEVTAPTYKELDVVEDIVQSSQALPLSEGHVGPEGWNPLLVVDDVVVAVEEVVAALTGRGLVVDVLKVQSSHALPLSEGQGQL